MMNVKNIFGFLMFIVLVEQYLCFPNEKLVEHAAPLCPICLSTIKTDEHPQAETINTDEHPQAVHPQAVTINTDEHPQAVHPQAVTINTDEHPQAETINTDEHPQAVHPQAETINTDEHPQAVHPQAETINTDEHPQAMPCAHVFHQKCINSWLKQHNTCPMCRRTVIPDALLPPGNLNRNVSNVPWHGTFWRSSRIIRLLNGQLTILHSSDDFPMSPRNRFRPDNQRNF